MSDENQETQTRPKAQLWLAAWPEVWRLAVLGCLVAIVLGVFQIAEELEWNANSGLQREMIYDLERVVDELDAIEYNTRD